MKREIKVKLSPDSINAAISELKTWYKDTKDKAHEFLRELATQGVQIANAKFAMASYDGTNDVTVRFEDESDTKVAVVATGSATLFIEFGTGVTYPDNHPEMSKSPAGRGQYGYGLGKMKRGWYYDGDPGTDGVVVTHGKHAGSVHTFGNQANMCMYNTVKDLEDVIADTARRIFNG